MGKTDDGEKPPQNHKRANRILDAASKLIVHYGFDKTTVDDIAREAGVSKGAVYLHWSSKDDLFEALIWRESWAYLEDILAAIEADPKGGTLVAFLKHSMLCLVKRPLMRAFYNRDLRIVGDYVKRRDPQVMEKKYLLNKELIQAMQGLGLVRKELAPDVIAAIFASFSVGFLMLSDSFKVEGEPSFEQVFTGLTDMLDRSLTPDDIGDTEAGKRLFRSIVDQYVAMTPGVNRLE